MARTGRPAKAIELHKRDGTKSEAGGRDKRATTPLLLSGRAKPEPSKHLTALQKKHFRQLARELAPILDGADRGILELASIELAKIEKCNVDIEAAGMWLKGQSDVNPLVAVQEKALVHARQLLDMLGSGPAGRARLAGMGVRAKTAQEGGGPLGQMFGLPTEK